MTDVIFTQQRRNICANPRAAVDNTGWPDAVRVTQELCPATFPEGADAAFWVEGASGGFTCDSEYVMLPADVQSGDWLWCSYWAFMKASDEEILEEGDVRLWADIEFRDGDYGSEGWSSFCHDAPPPLEEFVKYQGLCQVSGTKANDFTLFIKVDEVVAGKALVAEIFFTLVMIEPVPYYVDEDGERQYAVHFYPPDYADGDSLNWAWEYLPHQSVSKESVELYLILDPIEVTTIDVGPDEDSSTGTYTPDVEVDLGFCAEFGPMICRIYPCVSTGGGIITPENTTEVESGENLTFTWVAAAGYDFEQLKVDDVATAPTSTGRYEFVDVVDDHTIDLYFQLQTRTLTYAAGEHGFIRGDASQTVNYGEAGTAVRAVPDEGYEFVEWSDGILTSVRNDTGVTENISVTASFQAISSITYDLTYTAGDNGTLTGDGSQTVARGANGTEVTAVPDEGFEFDSWDDNPAAPANRTDRAVMAEVVAQAQFIAIVMHDVAYTAASGGSISGEATQSVADTEDATPVSAVASAGYRFSQWSDLRKSAGRWDLNVTEDLTLEAQFTEGTSHTLSYSAGTGGTLSGATPQTVEHMGAGTKVTAVPDIGYRFQDWSDGRTTAQRMDINVATDITVVANFTTGTYSLHYRGIGGGSIEGDEEQLLSLGDTGSMVEAVPDEGYEFTRWNDGVLTAQRSDVVVGNLRAYARFRPLTYELEYSAGSGGVLRGAYSQTVRYGRRAMPITAVPLDGYHFVSWSDGVTTARRQELVVDAPITATAEFAAD